MKEKKFNCIGFAYHKLGIIKTEKPINILRYKSITKDFAIARQNNEDAICALWKDLGVLVAHLAVVDPNDKKFVMHRPGTSKAVCRETREEAFKPYKSRKDCLIINLKLRRQPSTLKNFMVHP